MKKLVFLASAKAMKPEILIRSFYESINPQTPKGILLTNGFEGNVVNMAYELGMEIIVTPNSKFEDIIWCEKELASYTDHILVSCGWPYRIPSIVLEKFFAAINCHGSYLPDYRGSRAYMHYWANCEKYYGATIHYINENFDDGSILVRGKLKMFKGESQNDIFIRTAELCGHLLVSAVLLASENYSGYDAPGEKRYFYKRTPEEFEQYRKENEQRIQNGQEILLTPHKRID